MIWTVALVWLALSALVVALAWVFGRGDIPTPRPTPRDGWRGSRKERGR